MNDLLSGFTALLAFLFAIALLDQWRERRQPFQLVWAIGMAFYGIAAGCEALAAAERIGKVHVDHGNTACTTPDAAAYIQKTLGRAAEPKAKPARPKK